VSRRVEDALHLTVEYVARQPVLGDAEAHHAARHRAGLADSDGVSSACELVGSRQTRGARADNEHALAGRLGLDRQLPAVLDGLIAEETLDAVDPTASSTCARLHEVSHG